MCTVEPLIVDPLNKGHNRNNLSIKDASLGPKCSLSYSTNTLTTSKERTTSLQRVKWLVPTCLLFGGSTIIVYQTCHCYSLCITVRINLMDHDEEYEFTLPSAYARYA